MEGQFYTRSLWGAPGPRGQEPQPPARACGEHRGRGEQGDGGGSQEDWRRAGLAVWGRCGGHKGRQGTGGLRGTKGAREGGGETRRMRWTGGRGRAEAWGLVRGDMGHAGGQ